MTKLKIALAQMKSDKGKIQRNLHVIEEYVKKSSLNGCEIVCFPEMSITGYINPFGMPDAILNLRSDVIKSIASFSRTYNIVVIAGFVEENENDKPFITQIVVKDGEIVCVYRKITIADDEKDWFSPGSTLGIFSYNGMKMGITICADINNEQLFHEYAKNGVEFIFESASPGLYGEQATRNWESGYKWWKDECYKKLGKYAKNNQLQIAVSTHAGRTIDEDFPGGGYVFSKEGHCIVESADWNEGLLFAEIEI